MITTTPRGGETSHWEPEITGGFPAVRTGPGRFSDLPDDQGPSRTIWWVAGLVFLTLLVVVAIVYYSFRPFQVQVSIDGATQSVDTRADSVGDLLAEMGVTVSDGDLVQPALAAELIEGSTVTVRYARPLTLMIDGAQTEHVTTALTVGEALEEIGAPMDGSALSVGMDELLPRDGMMVEVTTPKSLTLDVGGEIREVTSTGRTVADVLAAEGVELGELDTVAPAPETAVTAAMAITVTVVRVENEVRTEPIPHGTTEQEDADLTVGTREVVSEGVDGSQDVTYAVTYTNGELTSEEVVSSTVTLEPVNEVVTVGTKPAPTPVIGGATSDLNWAALAQCESSGNPSAVNPAGYYGLYQFSIATWQSVGGTGNPADASPEEQTLRAQILYDRSGPGQWPHCGPRLFS